MGTYKDLKVWQLNQENVLESARLFENLAERYADKHIAKQLFRAISSIGASIAEGQDSYEGKEFVRYLNIAIRSAIECDYWLNTLISLSGSNKSITEILNKNVEVIKMLKGLKKSIETKRNSDH